MTHKILNTCNCPLFLLIIDCHSIMRHRKDGTRLRGTPHHKCCQLKHPKTAYLKNDGNTKKTRNNMLKRFCEIRQERKPGWLQNAKTLLVGTRGLLSLTSTRRCSRRIEWHSAFADPTSDPVTQPSSSKTSSSCPKGWETEKGSLPMMISVQEQLKSCPTGERAVTIDSRVLKKSSRKRRQSLRNSFRRKLPSIFSRHDNRQVPSQKWSSSMTATRE